MFYTIYKVTNKVNDKIYIGKHQTKDLDDGYMGSGKHLKRAQEKYGLESFKKEILHIFDNEDEMNLKEAELVTEEFVLEDTNYNLCPGGKGGWGYVNSNSLTNTILGGIKSQKVKSEKRYKVRVQQCKLNSKKANLNSPKFTGKKHTKQTKEKMMGPRPQSSGSKNSQYGTMWITDGNVAKKIKKDDPIPEGWKKGRK